jgi:hypothetical protein
MFLRLLYLRQDGEWILSWHIHKVSDISYALGNSLLQNVLLKNAPITDEQAVDEALSTARKQVPDEEH